MSGRIIHKRSLTGGAVPTTSSLEIGELAINVNDGKAFLRRSGSGNNDVVSIVTANTVTTGSITISGSTTLTGSLNITGSTTQTGNNTLIGNTLLTGSITISGSNPPGSTVPSVRIWGDTQHNGYIRFDPVTTNIDTSISASYIYVSGSTNDLYFSQNGAGYNNVTRLRWLEGNLYTGLLHGGAISQVNSNTYKVASGSGIIVNLNASLAVDPYPTIQFLNWGDLTKTIDALSASYDQQFIAISSSGQIYTQGTPYFNGEVDRYIPVGIVLHQNRSSINAVKTQPSLAYGWKQRSNVFISAFGPLKLSGHALATSSSRGLTVGSGTSFADGANYPTDPNNPSYVTDPGTNISKIFRYRQSGSNWVYDTNAGAGYTTIDPTQYSLNGTLTSVANNSWSIQRVYWFPNSVSKAIVVYYGNAVYSTESEAIANINIEPFTEAPNTAANAIYVGAIVIKGDGTFTVDADFTILPGGLFRGVGGGGGGGGGTTSPGGSNTQIQYNNNNAFGGVPVLTYNGTTLSATGSFTGSFTGSLLGTASYALNGGVTQLLAGPNITLSPANGLGQVTVTSTGGGGIYGNTATGSYGSFYDTTTQTNPAINAINSMSLNTTDISNGVSISGSLNPYNTYIKITNAGVYNIQFSVQITKTNPGGTDSTYIWLRKNGIDLAETNTEFDLSQNGQGVAAWNWFVNAAANDYYQIMWSSDTTGIQLTATTPAIGPTVPSVIVTANRVDQFLSNTGSFSGSFTGVFTGSLLGTASWATNALTASFLPIGTYSITASWAQSASNAINAQTASFLPVGTYQITSSWAEYVVNGGNVDTSSLVTTSSFNTFTSSINSFTASYNTGSFTGSFTGSLNGTSSWATNAQTASFLPLGTYQITSSWANSASQALTASYITGSTFTSINPALSASYALTASSVSSLIQNVTITGSLVVSGSGATLELYGDKIIAGAVGGDEGGEILLGKPVTNSSLTGSGITIDAYQNRIRFFEQGGTARGAYIDLTACAAGVGTNLLSGGGGTFNSTSSIIGNGLSSSFDINHGFNTRNLHITVYESGSNGETVYPDIRRINANTASIIFANPPALDEYIVYISQ